MGARQPRGAQQRTGTGTWRGPAALATVARVLRASGDPYGAEGALLAAPAPDCAEATLQARVEELLSYFGWEWFHDRDARQDRAGFPDIVACHAGCGPDGQGRVLYAELKTARGRLSAAQRRWRDALLAAGADWRLWRPADWPRLVATLRGNDAPADAPNDGQHGPREGKSSAAGDVTLRAAATRGAARPSAGASAQRRTKPAERPTRRAC